MNTGISTRSTGDRHHLNGKDYVHLPAAAKRVVQLSVAAIRQVGVVFFKGGHWKKGLFFLGDQRIFRQIQCSEIRMIEVQKYAQLIELLEFYIFF